jgi:hypothetical protein
MAVKDDKNGGKPKKPKPAKGAPEDDEDTDENPDVEKKKYAPISPWDKIIDRLNARYKGV